MAKITKQEIIDKLEEELAEVKKDYALAVKGIKHLEDRAVDAEKLLLTYKSKLLVKIAAWLHGL
jgi:archaellum component FlaC